MIPMPYNFLGVASLPVSTYLIDGYFLPAEWFMYRTPNRILNGLFSRGKAIREVILLLLH